MGLHGESRSKLRTGAQGHSRVGSEWGSSGIVAESAIRAEIAAH